MSIIKNNCVYNLPTIESFIELEKSKYSKNLSKSDIKFMYHFGADTYFYFYEDSNRYFLIDGIAADKLKLNKLTFKDFEL